MKKVFNSISQCAHVWAQNNQDEGRAGNISFRNGVIYSYGYWPMAAFVKNAKGEQVVLIRTETYSVSTSRHQRYVRSALPSYVRTITLYGELSDDTDNWVPNEAMRRSVRWRVADSLGKAKRARKHTHWHLEDARKFADAFNELLTFFKTKGVKPLVWDDNADAMMQELQKQAAAQNKRDEKERAEQLEAARVRREKDQAEAVVNLAVWEQGGPSIGSWAFHDLPCALRVKYDEPYEGAFEGMRIKGVIQTSHGAQVPLSYARRLWTLIVCCRDKGTDYEPKDFQVGHFQLQKVDKDGTLHIGCHTIPYESIVPIARQLGYLGEEVAA